jgi:protein-L-isoaspartate(D-aspartate) O-methyltransferase
MLDFSDARLKMVDNQLRAGGVSDHRLLAAMGEVRRELFVPAERRDLAYADLVHPLGNGRYLGAPAPFAQVVQLAEVGHSDHVLVIGAGAGYGAAVLARIAVEVSGLEADAALASTAQANLAAEGAGQVRIVVGGFDGTSLVNRRFDAIIVEGTVDREPIHLFALLNDGGRLVALVQANGPATAMLYVKSGDEVTARSAFNASLPPLPSVSQPEVFAF